MTAAADRRLEMRPRQIEEPAHPGARHRTARHRAARHRTARPDPFDGAELLARSPSRAPYLENARHSLTFVVALGQPDACRPQMRNPMNCAGLRDRSIAVQLDGGGPLAAPTPSLVRGGHPLAAPTPCRKARAHKCHAVVSSGIRQVVVVHKRNVLLASAPRSCLDRAHRAVLDGGPQRASIPLDLRSTGSVSQRSPVGPVQSSPRAPTLA